MIPFVDLYFVVLGISSIIASLSTGSADPIVMSVSWKKKEKKYAEKMSRRGCGNAEANDKKESRGFNESLTRDLHSFVLIVLHP